MIQLYYTVEAGEYYQLAAEWYYFKTEEAAYTKEKELAMKWQWASVEEFNFEEDKK